MNTPIDTPQTAQEARFWAKVTVAAPDECWLWKASRGGSGYGHAWIEINGERRCVDAHKLAWTLTHGPVPEGQVVRHRCNQKLCCNPAHMQLGTHADNSRDAMRDGLAGVKLRADDIREIIRERYAFRSCDEIARNFGVRKSFINDILTGHRWHCVTGLTATVSTYIGEQISFDL
jgi:hypothetical protein